MFICISHQSKGCNLYPLKSFGACVFGRLTWTDRLGTADTSFIATGAVLTAGRCDCVAIWVDYCLWEPQIGLSDSSPGPCLKDEAVGGSRELSTSAGVTVTQDVIEWRAWDGQDFPYYYTLNLKFFEQPQPVEKGATFSSCATFKMGDSDFAFEFSFV